MFFAIEEREQGEAAATGYGLDFVEEGRRKRDGIACRGAIAVGAKFGEDEMTAFVIVVEVEREGKAAVAG